MRKIFFWIAIALFATAIFLNWLLSPFTIENNTQKAFAETITGVCVLIGIAYLITAFAQGGEKEKA